MQSVDSLQRRRAALVRRHQSQCARVEHYTRTLVSAVNAADDLEAQIALVDKKINDATDRTIANITSYHEQYGTPE